MTDLTDTIAENAAGPRKMEADGMVAEQHSLPDQIAADKYAKGQAAAASGGIGVRFLRIKAPGAGG